MFERDPIKTKFYNSRAWRRLSKSYAEGKGYICELCGNKYAKSEIKPFYKQFHVHHKIELTAANINDPSIALNEDNLMLLCQHCHNVVTTQREVLAPGLEFDEKGMVRKIWRKDEKQSRPN